MRRLVLFMLTVGFFLSPILADENEISRLGDGTIVRKLKDRHPKPEPNQPPHVPFFQPTIHPPIQQPKQSITPERFGMEVLEGVAVAIAASIFFNVIRFAIKRS